MTKQVYILTAQHRSGDRFEDWNDGRVIATNDSELQRELYNLLDTCDRVKFEIHKVPHFEVYLSVGWDGTILNWRELTEALWGTI